MPGIYPRILMRFFGFSVSNDRYQKILSVSAQYSKSRAWYYPKAGLFSSDSKAKKAGATDAMRKWAKLLMEPSYKQLSQLATTSFSGIITSYTSRNSPVLRMIPMSKTDESLVKDWSPLKPMPIEFLSDTIDGSDEVLFTSDSNFETKIYNPFSTSFNSSYYEVRGILI